MDIKTERKNRSHKHTFTITVVQCGIPAGRDSSFPSKVVKNLSLVKAGRFDTSSVSERVKIFRLKSMLICHL